MWLGFNYNLSRVFTVFTMMAFIVTGPSLSFAQSYDPHKTVTKAEFEKIGDKIIEMYDAELTKKNIYLVNKGDWSAKEKDIRIQTMNYPYVDLFYNGGEIRSQKINLDQLSLILCHEMGHLLGEGAKITNHGVTATAGEGEADYFATFKGLKKLWAGQKGITLEESGLPQKEKHALTDRLKQKGVDPKSESGMMAIRMATAGYFVLTKLNGHDVSFAGFDNNIVKKTITDYPTAQSRLDTYIAGALNYNRPASWSAAKVMRCGSLF